MVAHENVGMNPHSESTWQTSEQLEKMQIRLRAGKDLATFDATVEYVVPTIGHIDTQRSRHIVRDLTRHLISSNNYVED